jgi:hypothetical protein
MIAIARMLSWTALGGTILPALLFWAGRITLDQTKAWMFVATVVWFATAPLWMDRRQGD